MALGASLLYHGYLYHKNTLTNALREQGQVYALAREKAEMAVAKEVIAVIDAAVKQSGGFSYTNDDNEVVNLVKTK